MSVFSVGAGGALTPVTGSPFATGQPCGSSCGPRSVAFSPDGKLLATASYCGDSVSVFSVGAGGALTPVTGSPFPAGDPGATCTDSVAFSPDGKLLATANFDYGSDNAGSVSVFSVGADGALTPVTGSPFATGAVTVSVAFSPDGSLLATANEAEHGVGVLGRRGRRAHPGRRFAVLDARSAAVVGGVQSGRGAARDRGHRQQRVGVLGRCGRRAHPGRRLAVPGGRRGVGLAALGCVQSGREPARDRKLGRRREGVSLFSVGAGGVLTPVVGSPFSTGSQQYAVSVAFSPAGGLLAIANAARRGRQRVGVLARLADQGRAAVGADQLAG